MQYPWVNIDPEDEDGIELATRLDSWVAAVLSGHMDTSEPSDVVDNQMWTDDVSSTVRIQYINNGLDNVELWRWNPTALTCNIAHNDEIVTWLKAQRQTPVALTSGTTITPDFADSNYYSLTLSHNATLANPSNQVAGQGGMIVINHDGTHTLAFGSRWKFEGGDVPSLSSVAAKDVLVWYADTSTSIVAALLLDVK